MDEFKMKILQNDTDIENFDLCYRQPYFEQLNFDEKKEYKLPYDASISKLYNKTWWEEIAIVACIDIVRRILTQGTLLNLIQNEKVKRHLGMDKKLRNQIFHMTKEFTPIQFWKHLQKHNIKIISLARMMHWFPKMCKEDLDEIVSNMVLKANNWIFLERMFWFICIVFKKCDLLMDELTNDAQQESEMYMKLQNFFDYCFEYHQSFGLQSWQGDLITSYQFYAIKLILTTQSSLAIGSSTLKIKRESLLSYVTTFCGRLQIPHSEGEEFVTHRYIYQGQKKVSPPQQETIKCKISNPFRFTMSTDNIPNCLISMMKPLHKAISIVHRKRSYQAFCKSEPVFYITKDSINNVREISSTKHINMSEIYKDVLVHKVSKCLSSSGRYEKVIDSSIEEWILMSPVTIQNINDIPYIMLRKLLNKLDPEWIIYGIAQAKYDQMTREFCDKIDVPQSDFWHGYLYTDVLGSHNQRFGMTGLMQAMESIFPTITTTKATAQKMIKAINEIISEMDNKIRHDIYIKFTKKCDVLFYIRKPDGFQIIRRIVQKSRNDI